ncbi:hypothetical protein ANN_11408 [Periplaneta americana]|uniref:Uncharacterized protein n=1 Tax=Periplaneta americana TaxID=6978 RepID=A0ABQ8T4Y5_PERAM|nr:hypothetical protein ANN_11408 [Periplaneta americana]
MLYFPKKYRGLSLMKASCEAYIQHINICNTLLRVDDCHLHNVRDLVSDKVSALSKLNITTIDAINWSGRKIRKHLRNDAFQTWTNHTLGGKGIIVYSDLPKANSWVSNRKGLSSSEWTNDLKMSSNISAVRAIPGRTLSTTRCRHSDCSELETLGHVLGQCPKGELLINARHHRVLHALATSLKTLNWEIHEEVHCVSSDGSFRRADIIAINGHLKRALVLDPTIRFERNLNQATEVDIEKKSIYEPCLPYLSQKYNVPLKQWSVIGLLFGSRGSISKFTWNYLKELHIPFDYREEKKEGKKERNRERKERKEGKKERNRERKGRNERTKEIERGKEGKKERERRKKGRKERRKEIERGKEGMKEGKKEREERKKGRNERKNEGMKERNKEGKKEWKIERKEGRKEDRNKGAQTSHLAVIETTHYQRIPNLSAEESDGITVFRISPMASLMLHRCRTGAISLQRWWQSPSVAISESDWFLYRAGISRRKPSCTVVSWRLDSSHVMKVLGKLEVEFHDSMDSPLGWSGVVGNLFDRFYPRAGLGTLRDSEK